MAVKVTHILKDGTRLDDITGHVVRYEDCPEVYHLLAEIGRRIANEGNNHPEVDPGDGTPA